MMIFINIFYLYFSITNFFLINLIDSVNCLTAYQQNPIQENFLFFRLNTLQKNIKFIFKMIIQLVLNIINIFSCKYFLSILILFNFILFYSFITDDCLVMTLFLFVILFIWIDITVPKQSVIKKLFIAVCLAHFTFYFVFKYSIFQQMDVSVFMDIFLSLASSNSSIRNKLLKKINISFFKDPRDNFMVSVVKSFIMPGHDPLDFTVSKGKISHIKIKVEGAHSALSRSIINNKECFPEPDEYSQFMRIRLLPLFLYGLFFLLLTYGMVKAWRLIFCLMQFCEFILNYTGKENEHYICEDFVIKTLNMFWLKTEKSPTLDFLTNDKYLTKWRHKMVLWIAHLETIRFMRQERHESEYFLFYKIGLNFEVLTKEREIIHFSFSHWPVLQFLKRKEQTVSFQKNILIKRSSLSIKNKKLREFKPGFLMAYTRRGRDPDLIVIKETIYDYEILIILENIKKEKKTSFIKKQIKRLRSRYDGRKYLTSDIIVEKKTTKKQKKVKKIKEKYKETEKKNVTKKQRKIEYLPGGSNAYTRLGKDPKENVRAEMFVNQKECKILKLLPKERRTGYIQAQIKRLEARCRKRNQSLQKECKILSGKEWIIKRKPFIKKRILEYKNDILKKFRVREKDYFLGPSYELSQEINVLHAKNIKTKMEFIDNNSRDLLISTSASADISFSTVEKKDRPQFKYIDISKYNLSTSQDFPEYIWVDDKYRFISSINISVEKAWPRLIDEMLYDTRMYDDVFHWWYMQKFIRVVLYVVLKLLYNRKLCPVTLFFSVTEVMLCITTYPNTEEKKIIPDDLMEQLFFYVKKRALNKKELDEFFLKYVDKNLKCPFPLVGKIYRILNYLEKNHYLYRYFDINESKYKIIFNFKYENGAQSNTKIKIHFTEWPVLLRTPTYPRIPDEYERGEEEEGRYIVEESALQKRIEHEDQLKIIFYEDVEDKEEMLKRIKSFVSPMVTKFKVSVGCISHIEISVRSGFSVLSDEIKKDSVELLKHIKKNSPHFLEEFLVVYLYTAFSVLLPYKSMSVWKFCYCVYNICNFVGNKTRGHSEEENIPTEDINNLMKKLLIETNDSANVIYFYDPSTFTSFTEMMNTWFLHLVKIKFLRIVKKNRDDTFFFDQLGLNFRVLNKRNEPVIFKFSEWPKMQYPRYTV